MLPALCIIGALLAVGLAGRLPSIAFTEFNQIRILELLLLTIISGSYIFHQNIRAQTIEHISRTHTSSSLLLAMFLILGLLSTLNAQQIDYAIQDWAHYFLLMLSTCIVACFATKNIRLVMIALLGGLAIGSSLAIARFAIQLAFTIWFGVLTPLAHWWEPYSNPRFIAQALIWITPLLTTLPGLVPVFRKECLAASYVLGSAVWMLLFWTGSRAEILSLALSMALIAILMWRQAFPFLARMSLTACAGFTLWLLTRFALNSGTLGGDSLSFARFGVSGRDWLYHLSIELITQHPWLGVGPANFSAYNHDSLVASAHPHNLILQIAAEWGLPATALLVVLLWKFIKHQYQSAIQPLVGFDSTSNLRHAIRIPLLITLLAVIFTSMLDGIHVMPLSQLIGVPILGLMIAINTKTNEASATTQLNAWRMITPLLLILWGIIFLSLYQQRDCFTYPIRAEQLIGGQVGYDNPRFWAQGRIPFGDGCLEIGRYQNGTDTLMNRSVDAPNATEQYWR